MKARFIKAAKLPELESNISENIESYRTGNFDFLLNDSAYFFESELVINESKLASIDCSNNDLKEVESCMIMYKAMGNISHYLARDQRLWVYLTHTYLLKYARNRWPIPADHEKAIKHIKTHFFCIGARGIERDNAASRLWWLAALCSRADGISLQEALVCFLYQSDVRANMVERPTTSQNVLVFSAILNRLSASYNANKELFEREKFRSFMKELNLIGGVKLLGALPKNSIIQILDECIAKA